MPRAQIIRKVCNVMTCPQIRFEALSRFAHGALHAGSIGLFALGISFAAHQQANLPDHPAVADIEHQSKDLRVTTSVWSANVVWGSCKRTGFNVVWRFTLREG